MKARRSRRASVVVARVDERVAVDGLAAPSRPASRIDGDRGGRSLMSAEGRDRAGRDAERLHQELGLPKESRPAAPIRLVQRASGRSRASSRRRQEERVLLVLEEQVLGMAAGESRRAAPGFLDGEERRVRRPWSRRCRARRGSQHSSSRRGWHGVRSGRANALDGGAGNQVAATLLQWRPMGDISRGGRLSARERV